MAANPLPSGRLRFDDFELDVRAGQLRRQGVRLRLRGQPLQVLEILLERAGDVVTREELQSRIWSADTFVDFDHSLHNAIARIREVLGDSAENPRYIETLPRRGYRYIGPVEETQAPAAPAEKADDAGEVVSFAAPEKRKSGFAVVVRVVILCALLALGLIGWTTWRSARTKAGPRRSTPLRSCPSVISQAIRQRSSFPMA
jgi:DNA-binding winged helix-turn-helix (wHTH) protein